MKKTDTNEWNFLKEQMPIETVDFNSENQRSGLVMVDLIKGFCEPGAGNLAPVSFDPVTDQCVKSSNEVAVVFAQRKMPILVLMDAHDPNKLERPFLKHAVKGTHEAELMPELTWLYDEPMATLIEKDCINGFVAGLVGYTGGNLVLEWMNKNKLDVLVVVGVCTDICVMQFVLTMLSVRQHEGMAPFLKEVVVYLPAVTTYDLSVADARALNKPDIKAHPRAVTEYTALYFMVRSGAILADNIRFK